MAIVEHLKDQGHKILWAPDRHLGRYIQEQTGADMLLWHGDCIVHDEFKGLELELLRSASTRTRWCWCTPSRRRAWCAQADVVGSTTQLLKAVVDGSAQTYIVATDNGILHRMRQLAPGKTLLEAPTAGRSATCKSCAHCPWMAMNALQGVVACLEHRQPARSTFPSRRAARPWLHRAHARLREGPSAEHRSAAQRFRARHRGGLRVLR